MNSICNATNYTEFKTHVYRDVQKDLNLCDSERSFFSQILWFAKQDKVCTMKNLTLGLMNNLSVKRIKNILWYLTKLGYIRRKRSYRKHHIYVAPTCKYFINHEIYLKQNQIWEEELKSYTQGSSVDNSEPLTTTCGTLLCPDSINNNIKNNNTASPFSFFTKIDHQEEMEEKPPDKKRFRGIKNLPLIRSLARRRKVVLTAEREEELCFHVDFGLSNPRCVKNLFELIQQGLSLIIAGVWSMPFNMAKTRASPEIDNEKAYIDYWQAQKEAEIGSYQRTNGIFGVGNYSFGEEIHRDDQLTTRRECIDDPWYQEDEVYVRKDCDDVPASMMDFHVAGEDGIDRSEDSVGSQALKEIMAKLRGV